MLFYDYLTSPRSQSLSDAEQAGLVIAGLCGGRILQSATQILSIIEYNPVHNNAANSDSELNYPELGDAWSSAFARYLDGSGDPGSTRDYEQDGAENDSLKRSRMFLKAVTASQYLPLDPTKGIKVSCCPCQCHDDVVIDSDVH